MFHIGFSYLLLTRLHYTHELESCLSLPSDFCFNLVTNMSFLLWGYHCSWEHDTILSLHLPPTPLNAVIHGYVDKRVSKRMYSECYVSFLSPAT